MENYRIKEQYYDHIENEDVGKNIYLYDEKGFLKSIVNSKDSKDETKFVYNKSGLILSMENYINNARTGYSILKYKSDIIGRKKLKEMTLYGVDDNITDHYDYIYERKIRVKTIHYSTKKQKKIEYFHKYIEGKRIGTFESNGDEYSLREYYENNLLKCINTKSGGTVTFLWENGFSNYNYDLYYLS